MVGVKEKVGLIDLVGVNSPKIKTWEGHLVRVVDQVPPLEFRMTFDSDRDRCPLGTFENGHER